MSLDPQVKKILEETAALGLPVYHELSPAEARKQMLDLAPPVDPLLRVKRVEDHSIPGPGGEIPTSMIPCAMKAKPMVKGCRRPE